MKIEKEEAEGVRRGGGWGGMRWGEDGDGNKLVLN